MEKKQQQQVSDVASSKQIRHGSEEVNWKVFKRDTEAGRLLSRLYGVQSNKDCSIKYPKVKLGNQNLNGRTPWNQTDVNAGANLRCRNKKGVVKVPKFGQSSNQKTKNSDTATHINKVESIPRRKSYTSCKKTWEQNSMLNRNYRPPVDMKKQKSSDEKERLCKLHEYGGGCALPDELTLPKRPMPEEVNKSKEKVIQESDEECLASAIVREIEERKQFQMEMEELGNGDSTREKIVHEITSRMKELSKIDVSRLTQFQ